MDVLMSFEGSASADALESLSLWLRGDPTFAGRIRTVRSAPKPGELGAEAAALIAAVSSTGFLTALASALKTWVARPRGAKLHIRLREQDRELNVNLVDIEHRDATELAKNIVDHGLEIESPPRGQP